MKSLPLLGGFPGRRSLKFVGRRFMFLIFLSVSTLKYGRNDEMVLLFEALI